MYYTSLLAYRFGGEIRNQLFLRGKNRNFLYILQRRPDPECFCAVTDAGPVCIITDFYGTRFLYLPNAASCPLQVKPLPHGKGSGLYLPHAGGGRKPVLLSPARAGGSGGCLCPALVLPAGRGRLPLTTSPPAPHLVLRQN